LRKIFTTNFSEVNNARGLKGERRPADVIGNAVHVMPIATGQITDDVPTPEQEGKSAAAVGLGRLGERPGRRNVGKTARSDCEKSGKSALGTSSGHHGVLGAAAGSVIGRHEANKRAKLQRQDRPTQDRPTRRTSLSLENRQGHYLGLTISGHRCAARRKSHSIAVVRDAPQAV
jgi:hypothetical protein